MGFVNAFKTGVNRAKRDGALRRGEVEKATQAVINMYNNCPKRSSSCQPKKCVKCDLR